MIDSWRALANPPEKAVVNGRLAMPAGPGICASISKLMAGYGALTVPHPVLEMRAIELGGPSAGKGQAFRADIRWTPTWLNSAGPSFAATALAGAAIDRNSVL